MKCLLVFFVVLFTVLFSFTAIAQKISLRSEGFEISFPEKIHKLVLDPLPAGTYSVGAGGYFPTIDSVFNKLSIDGIAGEVIIELTDNLYIAPTDTFGFFLNGPIPGAGPNSRVTIRPATNKNVTIEGSCFAVVHFLNTNYVTVDGVGLTGATTLTIHSLQNLQFPWNVGLEFMDNSDHNIVQNTIFISEDYTRGGIGGPAFYPDFFAGSLFAPDSNLIQNNFVKKSAIAIYVSAEFSAVKAIGNIVRGNIVGTETDSLIGWGIQAQFTQNTIIENNVIQNLRRQGNAFPEDLVPGINSFYGTGDIIRNNIVHNIKSSAGYTSTGILLSGDVGKFGSNNSVYNNMVYDVQSTSTQYDSRVTGIQMWNQNNPKIYYNSVYLTGNGANHKGSGALYIWNTCTNVKAKNNIFVNTRDESPYCASAINDYTAANLSSDHNDLYYQPNQYNCLVRIGSTDYQTLANWQATGQDLNSIFEMPNFVSPDLHIDNTISTLLDGHATPIAGITTDIDNDSRDPLIPDIGADEFIGPDGVENDFNLPTQYVFEQNYPNPFNPSTKISWQSPIGSQQTLKIYDILGNEVATVVDGYKPAGKYEVEFDAASLPSGVYFYQLKAGEFVSTKKMLLLK
jgi:hypothetical protein